MGYQNHWWITQVILIGTFVIHTQAAQLRFYHGSLKTYTAAPLEDSLKLLPYLNNTRVSMFYIFGYNETADGDSSVEILPAYLRKHNTNVIQLDWEEEAKATGLRAYEERAIPNAIMIGKQLGRAIVKLIENGISEDKIHIIGHSLGAQLSSYAGNTVQAFNYNLSRITGLDPAGPGFEGPSSIDGLSASNAKFVDILHTNPGVLGIAQSVGTVDFWANCGSFMQPGCCNVLCSHIRSWKIYTEAVTSPYAFPAAAEENCSQWQEDKDIGSYLCVNYLGDMVNRRARGNFYFSTNGKYPYSKGLKGLIPNKKYITDTQTLFCSIST